MKLRAARVVWVVALCFAGAADSQAQVTVTTVHRFDEVIDGRTPRGRLIQASDGNIYGTTSLGGARGGGTVFRVAPNDTVTVVYALPGTDTVAGVIQGSDGNLYGVTRHGSDAQGNHTGLVFRVTTSGNYTELHRFPFSLTSEGSYPEGELVQGSPGVFYGTTLSSFLSGRLGTVFRITSTGAFSKLVELAGHSQAGLVMGNDGNFYGTTFDIPPSTANSGSIFRVTPTGSLTTLHTFSGPDGATPQAPLVLGHDGNFYGTTSLGGQFGLGTVFRITPAGTLTTLHSFDPSVEGWAPNGLTLGNDGNFYGTTKNGGASGGAGTIFRITPSGSLTTLHTFSALGTGGHGPIGGLVQASNGTFYGTASQGGGASFSGTVFKFSLPASAPPPTPAPIPGTGDPALDALPTTWHLPEGATGFFSERIAVANPATTSAAFTVTFLPESGAPIAQSYSLAGQRRMTIDVAGVPGLANAAVSAVVTNTSGRVVVERTMMWDARDGSFYGGHSGKAIPQPRTTWYLAEGEASFFETYILLANANTSAASVTLAFLLENGNTITHTRTVGANSRVTVYANEVAGLRGNAFSTTITSNIPIAVERAMYFGNSVRLFNGGHGAAAVEAPATSWFVAEGRTGPFFDMYLLLANPGTAPANATITFLLPNGSTVVQTRTLNPTSRTTIHVDSVPGLADTDVSASITSTQPIIVERAMYWPDPFTNWYEAHNSSGVTATGMKWALAEGEVGGGLGFETYILLANPNGTAASVTLAFLRESSSPLTLTRTVPANGRLTISAGEVALVAGERFGVLIDSSQPIAVERAMYWNGGGQFWGAGTNETGIRIR